MSGTSLVDLVVEATEERQSREALIEEPKPSVRESLNLTGKGRILAGVVLFTSLTLGLFAGRSLTSEELPTPITPAAVADLLELESVVGVGTMLHGRLVERPTPEGHDQFAVAVHRLGARAKGEGYASLLIEAPDGTVLASGAVDAIWIAPPNHQGS